MAPKKYALLSKLRILFLILCCYGIASYSMETMSSILASIAKAFESPTASPIYYTERTPPDKILTLFTTSRASEQKLEVQKTTILNWSLMKNRVNLIYYFPRDLSQWDKELHNLAKQNGWQVRKCPRTSGGIPILRSMFIDAQNVSDTAFYGYANGDILFTDSLLNTLDILYNYLFEKVLLVGQRTNYNTSYGGNLSDWNAIKMAAEMNGTLFGTNAQDYFITVKNGFPWTKIPDFVVGRIGYDNWLVVTSIVRDIPVVDVTQTVLALHQTGRRGNFEGHRNKSNGELYTNYRVAGLFDYSLGHTKCSQFSTLLNGTEIILSNRDENACRILYERKRKNFRFFRHAIQPLVRSNETSSESRENG